MARKIKQKFLGGGAPSDSVFLRGDQTWAAVSGASGGTVTEVTASGSEGVSASVANGTSTPAITVGLGAISPTSVSTGTVTSSTLTASELVATNGSKALVSLAVATYPSLTELSYVKGATSAIQTQISGKATTALDNLASVAINTSLVSDTDNTDDLGTSVKRWKDIYVSNAVWTPYVKTPATVDLNIWSGSATSGNTSGGAIEIYCGNGYGSGAGGSLVIGGGTGGATGAGGDMNFYGASGGATSGAGGGMTFVGGSASGGNSNGGLMSFESGAKSGSGTNGIMSFLQYDGKYKFNSGAGRYAIIDTASIATSDKTFTFPNQTATLSTATSGTSAPDTTPVAIGQIFCDTSAGKVYISTGTSASTDWKILN